MGNEVNLDVNGLNQIEEQDFMNKLSDEASSASKNISKVIKDKFHLSELPDDLFFMSAKDQPMITISDV
jgi:hypothetical protein